MRNNIKEYLKYEYDNTINNCERSSFLSVLNNLHTKNTVLYFEKSLGYYKKISFVYFGAGAVFASLFMFVFINNKNDRLDNLAINTKDVQNVIVTVDSINSFE